MKKSYFILALSVLSLTSCYGRHTTADSTKVIDQKAKQLNDSAVMVCQAGDTASLAAAVKLLDEAIKIRPDYYLAYRNKLNFVQQLGRTEESFALLKDIEVYFPDDPYTKSALGAYYESYKGDSLLAKTKYEEAHHLYLSQLDATQSRSKEYVALFSGFIPNLKLLGMEEEIPKHLKSFHKNLSRYKKEETEQMLEYLNRLAAMKREDLIHMTVSGKPTDRDMEFLSQ